MISDIKRNKNTLSLLKRCVEKSVRVTGLYVRETNEFRMLGGSSTCDIAVGFTEGSSNIIVENDSKGILYIGLDLSEGKAKIDRMEVLDVNTNGNFINNYLTKMAWSLNEVRADMDLVNDLKSLGEYEEIKKKAYYSGMSDDFVEWMKKNTKTYKHIEDIYKDIWTSKASYELRNDCFKSLTNRNFLPLMMIDFKSGKYSYYKSRWEHSEKRGLLRCDIADVYKLKDNALPSFCVPCDFGHFKIHSKYVSTKW